MKTADLPIVELSGAGRARGHAYGEAQRERIAEVVACWSRQLEVDQGLPAEAYLAEFLRKTNFLPAIRQHAPDLLDEIEGIAEAANQPFDTILALNLMDEEWWFGEQRRAAAGGEDRGDKCTALGIAGEGARPTYLAQNMDIAAWSEGRQVLLRVKSEDGLERLIFSFAGLISLMGMNSAGVGVCCNTLIRLSRSRKGLPVAFVSRSVLGQKSFDAAVRFLKNVPHASGQNYILGGDGRVVSLECSAHAVAEYWPEPGDQGRVWHTNHALANTDEAPIALGAYRRSPENSLARHACADRHVRAMGAEPGVEAIKALLASREDRDHPVSRRLNPEGGVMGYTSGSVIYALGPEPYLEIAPGPPNETDYRRVDFTPEDLAR
ncbi:MAG: C45 family peptidase [Roseovarius sp.]